MPSRLRTISLLLIVILVGVIAALYFKRVDLAERAITSFIRAKNLGELTLQVEDLNLDQIKLKKLDYRFSSNQFSYQVLLPSIQTSLKVGYDPKTIFSAELGTIEIERGRLLISRSDLLSSNNLSIPKLELEFKPSIKALRFSPALQIDYQIEIASNEPPKTELLRSLVQTWPEKLELLSGKLKMILNLSYPLNKTPSSSALALNLSGVSAQFDKITLAGGSLELKDQEISTPLVLSGAFELKDLGLAELASNLKAKLKLETSAENEYQLTVTPEITLLGAALRAKPLTFSATSYPKTVDLTLSSLNLAQLANLYKHEQLELEGLVDAFLPLKLELTKEGMKNIEIRNGKVKALGPGVIRYKLPAKQSAAMELATRALSNIHYDLLEAELNMGSGGELKLNVHIQGKNPDLDQNQPIVLNIALEENVYQLVKSVRLMQMKR